MKVNISIDDVSPHPLSSIKVLDRCFELIKIFPDIKFSLFIPIAYWRTIKQEIATEKPLTISEFHNFCNTIKNLPDNNFEICYHGLYHGIPGKSDNDEFQYLNKEQALEKFNLMFEIVKKAGLFDKFKPIFRPPAWRMSPGSILAAKESNIEILALSNDEYAKITYEKEDEKFKNVVYYKCNPPFNELKVFENNEIVYHACEWDKNFFSKEMTNYLISFIKNNNNIEFEFLQGLI